MRWYFALLLLAACRPTPETKPASPLVRPPVPERSEPELVSNSRNDLPQLTTPVDMPLGADDPVVACAQDDACELVEVGCCDHCNGGHMLSVASEHVETARARWSAPDCTTATCTHEACAPTWPWCDAGTCIRREREVWQTEEGERIVSLLVPNVAPSWMLTPPARTRHTPRPRSWR